jgi:hypothetical protein
MWHSCIGLLFQILHFHTQFTIISIKLIFFCLDYKSHILCIHAFYRIFLGKNTFSNFINFKVKIMFENKSVQMFCKNEFHEFQLLMLF